MRPIRPTAGWLLTLTIAAGVLVLFDEIRPAAQQPAEQKKERRSNRDEEMEQVGPTQFRVIPTDTPYDRWYERTKAKLPSFAGLMIQDVRSVALKPWPEMGVNGLYMRMA